MIRRLLATTALASIVATGAYAQDTKMAPEQAPAASSTMDSGSTANATSTKATQGDYLQNLSSDQYLASTLNGSSIYASNAPDAETIGDINNFLIGSDGKIVAAITDATVADQSKTLAIPFDQISWSMDDSGSPRAVLDAGADMLAQAPAFTTPDEKQALGARKCRSAGCRWFCLDGAGCRKRRNSRLWCDDVDCGGVERGGSGPGVVKHAGVGQERWFFPYDGGA